MNELKKLVFLVKRSLKFKKTVINIITTALYQSLK